MKLKAILIFLTLVLNFFIYFPKLTESFNSFYGKNLVGEVKMGRLWGKYDQWRIDAVEFSGWSEADKIDLSLEPQTQGLAVFEFTKPADAQVTVLQLSLTHPSQGSNKISVSPDQQTWQTFVENNRYQHFVPPRDISHMIGDKEKFWVKIEASNNTISGPPEVILYDFYLMFYQHEFKFPPLVLMLTTIFLPIFLIIRPERKIAIKFSLLFLVLMIGLQLSLTNLSDYRYRSFDSDVLCLVQEVPRFLSLDIKSAFLGNYCGNKESLNPLIIIAFWKLFGFGSEMGIRLSSLLFHLLTIALVFWYGKKIKSFAVGLVAALFIGTHPYLIQLSARGLRDSAFTFIITLFAYLLFETNFKKLGSKIAILLTSVFLIYLRLHSLIQLIGLTAISIIAKPKLKKGVMLLIMLLLIAWPLITTNLKTYNTWNYSEEMHLKWNTNVEFAGKPGFPSKESVTLNPFQGQPISAFTYFFRLHTIPDLLISTVKGTIKTFSELYFKNNWLGLILFILGSRLMFKARRYRYIPLMVFLLEIPHFFLVSKNLVEYRSMTQSLPFIGLTIGYIIDGIWKKLTRF